MLKKLMPEEELKFKFEAEFKNLLQGTFGGSEKVLTRANFVSNSDQVTISEVKNTLEILLKTCINSFEEIKNYSPSIELDEDKFQVKIKYD